MTTGRINQVIFSWSFPPSRKDPTRGRGATVRRPNCVPPYKTERQDRLSFFFFFAKRRKKARSSSHSVCSRRSAIPTRQEASFFEQQKYDRPFMDAAFASLLGFPKPVRTRGRTPAFGQDALRVISVSADATKHPLSVQTRAPVSKSIPTADARDRGYLAER